MCDPAEMTKMIQVRNVPDRLHRELMRRARRQGQTLTQYIEEILEREVARPTRDEVLAQIANRQPVELDPPAAEIVRQQRERR
jgi:plasmid stability protein